MRHQLSLETPLVSTVKILRIHDLSTYTTALPVECARLEITVPGYTDPAVVEVTPGFTLNLNACHLGLQTHGCNDETQTLPDGMYEIRYSVSPNDKVVVVYQHLRMTQTLDHYYRKLGTVLLGTCEPYAEQRKALRLFQEIRSFLEAAKAKVEYCHELEKGMELFLYAQRLLHQRTHCAPCGHSR